MAAKRSKISCLFLIVFPSAIRSPLLGIWLHTHGPPQRHSSCYLYKCWPLARLILRAAVRATSSVHCAEVPYGRVCAHKGPFSSTTAATAYLVPSRTKLLLPVYLVISGLSSGYIGKVWSQSLEVTEDLQTVMGFSFQVWGR